MIALALICIAALIGYWIALREVESPFFEGASLKLKAWVFAVGIGSSMAIVTSFLLMTGAL